MSRADGKLYDLLADEVCRALLRALLAADRPLAQRDLARELPYNSSTISRRMGELEDNGLVMRATAHAPYTLVFPEQTRGLLVAGLDLAHMAHEALADEAAEDARSLRKERLTVAPPSRLRGGR